MSEQAAANIESMFTSLVGNLPAAVYRCANDNHWTMAFISQYMETISGYPAADFVDNEVRSLASIIVPEDRHLVHQAVNSALATDSAFSVNYRIVDSSGNIRWIRDSGCGVFDSNGELRYLDGALFDETEQHRSEVKLAAQNVLHNNIVAHGLPKIKNYIKTLIETEKTDAETALPLTAVASSRISSVRQLDRLISNIVTLKGVDQTTDQVSIDSRSLVQQVIQEMATSIEHKSAVIEYGNLPEVFFNEAHLKQLFVQLIDNAIKFVVGDQPQVFIDATTADEKVTFSVSDNGMGFDGYFIDSAFELCLRGQNAVSLPGDGFGLTVCRSILASSDEKIWIASEPGQGSKIYFTVPVSG